jgi:hypothetical protein
MLPILEAITGPIGGRKTQIGFTVQWILSVLISWPIVIYLADLLWRALDVPSVKFARWCEALCEDPEWSHEP